MDTPASLRFENSFKSLVIPLSPDRHWDQKLFSLSELIPTTLTFLGPGKLTLEETLVPGGCALIQDYIPGRYNLVWETGEGRVYEGFFEIHPHSLSLDEMAGMFAALENKVPGITQNPDFNSGAYQDLGWAGGSDLKMRYLARQSEKIASALAAIQRQPIKALGQSYSLSPKSKRPTAKSQRYGQTHGSSALNYEPVKSLTFDTVENRQLKGMVSYLLGLADGLLQQAMQQQAAIERQLSKTRQEIATLKNNLGLLGAKNFSKTYSDWKGRLELGESEERRLLREGQAHELRYAPLKGLKTQLGLINCAPWFLKVPAPKYGESPRNLWRHRGYSEVYQAYLDLQSKNPGGEGAGASHPTSKLFEFYAFLLCHEMLLASGLSSELPMTAIVAGDSFGYLHPSGARVSLSYDKTVADVAAARQSEEPQLVSLTGSRRPDVCLELCGPSGELLAFLVVEVKYRRLKHIYQEQADTDVVAQLNAYSLFGYYEPGAALKRQVPNEVCVLYPQYGDARLVNDPLLGYDFIPIIPTHFDLMDSQFSPLFQKIQSFLAKIPKNP